MKVLTRRFQGLITSVIGPDQACSIPGRSINDNLLLVRDIKSLWGAQVSLKPSQFRPREGVDRVSHMCMERLLERLNIPRPLLCWARLCLADIMGRMVASRFGVRQECPLASLLYVIYLKLFLHAIRANPGIVGRPGGSG